MYRLDRRRERGGRGGEQFLLLRKVDRYPLKIAILMTVK